MRKVPIILVLLLAVAACQTTGTGSPDAVSRNPNYLDKGSFDRFDRSLNKRAYGYEVIPDPTGTAPTRLVEKFEVRPGDCFADENWSDCKKDRERSELSHKGGRDPIGKTYWYGWSLYLPADFPSIYPVKLALGQWHQESSHPVWMIQQQQLGIYLDDQVFGSTRKYHPLVTMDQARGNWTRFEFEIKWSKGDDGYINAFVNGEPVVAYEGRTSWKNRQYFKYGIYRSFMSRGAGTSPAQTVYYANVRRASTREGLQPRPEDRAGAVDG